VHSFSDDEYFSHYPLGTTKTKHDRGNAPGDMGPGVTLTPNPGYWAPGKPSGRRFEFCARPASAAYTSTSKAGVTWPSPAAVQREIGHSPHPASCSRVARGIATSQPKNRADGEGLQRLGASVSAASSSVTNGPRA
jgi:hypothetical protein